MLKSLIKPNIIKSNIFIPTRFASKVVLQNLTTINVERSTLASSLFKPYNSVTLPVPQSKFQNTLFFNQINNDQIDIIEKLENINNINDKTIYTDSVMRKRRLKMKKHKLRKRRRAQRSLKKRLGKL
ncbi:unnamed protein product [Candida verbasci]|uniref:Small ribosomal subunit protein mS38 n=1 Tax=Candida verbasci TaxID=1227364 RepID=A0A9W4TZK2_9ASCO|nr:unnamed protein product [Candida verbasci]